MSNTKTPLIVYVAGPYRAPTAFAREENIFEARRMGSVLARNGFMPVIPHANTAHFDGLADDEFFLEGTLELMRRCDAVFLLTNWEKSFGARSEKAEAERLSIPVFDKLEDLQRMQALVSSQVEQLKEALLNLDRLTGVVRVFELSATDEDGSDVIRKDLNNGTDA